jgi:hypothetical protein
MLALRLFLSPLRRGRSATINPLAVFSPLWKVNMSDRNIRAIEHKFRVGQSVDFFPGRGIDHRSKGQYTVVLLRPFDGDAPQYRIKNKVDGQERIVRENELGSR